jgi:DNA mismatch endonuclease (patch repair protein)
VTVFVDGCFWHGCAKPKHSPMPKNNAEFCAAKLGRNRQRDLLLTKTLRKAGWGVVRVWECDLARKHWPRVARRIRRALDMHGMGEVAFQTGSALSWWTRNDGASAV